MARKYELKRRAERQQMTQRRIVEAAVALHETLGGATTVGAIAERAGVDRPTVYRHFPDQQALFVACTGHYFALHPLPDPARWRAISEPAARLRAGLVDVYTFWRHTERMMIQAEREVDALPSLREALAPFFAYWQRAHDVLAEGWETDTSADGPERERTRRRLHAAVAHATAFATWRSLVREQGLSEGEAVDLMVCMVCCAASCGTIAEASDS